MPVGGLAYDQNCVVLSPGLNTIKSEDKHTALRDFQELQYFGIRILFIITFSAIFRLNRD